MEALIVRRGGSYGPYRKIIDASTTYTVPQTGKYRIVAIGKGGNGWSSWESTEYQWKFPGGAGGGGYVEVWLAKGTECAVTVSASVSSFGTLISATAGFSTDSEIAHPLAGSVSGSGVIPFSSNGTRTKSIIPPPMYTEDSSVGGGAFDTAISGGAGLFGSDGGAGTKPESSDWRNATSTARTLAPTRGGGKGGDGKTEYFIIDQSSSFGVVGGGGGGGGYGGGGGGAEYYVLNAYWKRILYAGQGQGGGGCVFLERIG